MSRPVTATETKSCTLYKQCGKLKNKVASTTYKNNSKKKQEKKQMTENSVDIVAQAIAAASAGVSKKALRVEKTPADLAAERAEKDKLRASLAEARKAERAEKKNEQKIAREARRAARISEREVKRATQGAPKKPGMTSVEKAKNNLPTCPADLTEIIALDLRGIETVIAHLLVIARERKIVQNTYIPADGDLVTVVTNDPRLNAWRGCTCKVTSARKVRSIIERLSDGAELYVLNGDIAPAPNDDEVDEVDEEIETSPEDDEETPETTTDE